MKTILFEELLCGQLFRTSPSSQIDAEKIPDQQANAKDFWGATFTLAPEETVFISELVYERLQHPLQAIAFGDLAVGATFFENINSEMALTKIERNRAHNNAFGKIGRDTIFYQYNANDTVYVESVS